jgi:hypothetical protein
MYIPFNLVDEEKTLKTIKKFTMDILKGSLKICDIKSLNLILSSVNVSEVEDKRNSKRIFDDRTVLARKNSNR